MLVRAGQFRILDRTAYTLIGYRVLWVCRLGYRVCKLLSEAVTPVSLLRSVLCHFSIRLDERSVGDNEN
jgi:hypothetical protein